MADMHTTARLIIAQRRESVVDAAGRAGLLTGARNSIGARVSRKLLQAAKEKAGLQTTTEVVEYALAKVALEDDFASRLISRKGRAPRDLDLEF